MYVISNFSYMSTFALGLKPEWVGHFPQKNAPWVDARTAAVKTLVSVAIWDLELGDVIVTQRSNTRREILERNGNTFRFRTTQEFTGNSALNWNFSRVKDAPILTKSEIIELPLGTQLYGQNGLTMELVKIKNGGSTAVFRYEETQKLTQADIMSWRYIERPEVV